MSVMTDRYRKEYAVLDSVCFDGFAITPNNSNTYSQPTRGIYVGTSGNLTVQMIGYDSSNTILSFNNVVAGTILPIRVQIVYANTTANNLVGLF
jgi:hypothetical protein